MTGLLANNLELILTISQKIGCNIKKKKRKKEKKSINKNEKINK